MAKEPVTTLLMYDQARSMLSKCATVDEVKTIRDKALAMAEYARRAKDSEMEQWVSEIRVRAERAAGFMLRDMAEKKERKGDGTPPKKKNSDSEITVLPKLSDLGVSNQQSSQWQKIAAILEPKFEKIVEKAKEDHKPINTKAVLKAVAPPKPPIDPEIEKARQARRKLAARLVKAGYESAKEFKGVDIDDLDLILDFLLAAAEKVK